MSVVGSRSIESQVPDELGPDTPRQPIMENRLPGHKSETERSLDLITIERANVSAAMLKQLK